MKPHGARTTCTKKRILRKLPRTPVPQKPPKRETPKTTYDRKKLKQPIDPEKDWGMIPVKTPYGTFYKWPEQRM